ncbi:MAG: alpha/beta fold hydrolase, partial [Chloroflexi bacterium]|nr:alpha/beta fold hydrolase [Chloroflexota bacterium]
MARAVLLAPMLLALLLAAACGGDDDPGDAGDAGSRQGERRSDATVFTWESSDGVEIEAELRRGGPDWVLLGHQFTGSRRDWDQMVEGFAARGYTVLFWDFRCHGESGCNTVDGSKREATQDTWREWVAALDYAVANGARRIHAGGASMGGTSLIQVAAERDDIATIFAISSPNRFQGLDALEHYDQVTVPMLFIVGAGDKAAPDFSQRYFDRAAGLARLNILNTDLHGATLAKDGVWGRLVQPMLYEFVADPE